MLLASWTFNTFEKRIRSLNAVDMGSVGQKAAKLLAVNVGGLKKKSANRPRPHSKQSARVRCLARSNHSQSLMASNFAALWPTDSKFSAIKDLNLLKKHIKNQVASSILKVVFAFSKWPHLHRAYVISGCIFFAMAVHTKFIFCCLEKNMHSWSPSDPRGPWGKE